MNFALNKILLALLVLAFALGSCRDERRTAGDDEAVNDTVITQAQLLTMKRGEGYTLAIITDPWNEGRVLQRYVLVPADEELPTDLPDGVVVRTPLRHALVYSAVHTSLFKELGCWAAVRGVTDSQFFNDPDVTKGLENGTITDCGSSMQPTVEKVVAMQPDAILLSPYQDASYGHITELGIPIIECADYMEYTPLGRAEWIKFYGELLGKRAEADSVYEAVVARYNAIKQQVAQSSDKKPVVLTENVINGVWNVPGGQSYMACLIMDAGGDYPWADDKHTGSLTLDFNQVLARAQDADVWLIKSFAINSLDALRGSYSLNAEFEAFKRGQVYGCDTNAPHFFERFPFHPDVLLQEYYQIFHPSQRSGELVFFKKLQ
ncbi:MAG: ABC transporter substrate-binding protein [Muribaculaceae bacterium]|nr:ABC transporter substrate-binding protein [Muribaculaceae bacterium]